MRYAVPRIAPNVQLNRDGPGFYVLTIPATEVRARLSTAAVGLLFVADGVVSIENIDQVAEALDLPVPAGFVEQLFGTLHEAGLVRFDEAESLEHIALPHTAHHCEGCGRSCEGHLVGPLPTSEVQRVQGLYSELKGTVPRLADFKPFTRIDGDMFLTMDHGRCIFLAEDRHCELHAHFGAASKPTICQTFPFVRVVAEDGVRIAVKPDCLRHHRHSTRSLGPLTVSDGLAKLELDLPAHAPALYRRMGPPSALSLGDPTGAAVQFKDRDKGATEFLAQEAAVLTYLGQEDSTVRAMTALFMGAADSLDDTPQDSVTLSSKRLRPLTKVLARFRLILGETGTYVADLFGMEGGLGDDFRQLREHLGELSSSKARFTKVTYERGDELFILDAFRRLFFTRDALEYDGPQAAVATWLVGWTLALWSVARDGLTGAERYDALCERTVVWHRLTTTSELHRRLFRKQTDAELILSIFRG